VESGRKDMAIDEHFEMRREYLYAQVTGVFVRLDEFIKTYLKVLERADSYAATKILVDCLQLKGTPERMDYFKFGEFVATEARTRLSRKSALVGTPPMFDKEHFGELVANNRGEKETKVFGRIEDALKWLEIDPEEGRQSSPAGL
jgi:hypothetical protein